MAIRIVTNPDWGFFEYTLKQETGGGTAWTYLTETQPTFGLSIRAALENGNGPEYHRLLGLVADVSGLAADPLAALVTVENGTSEDVTSAQLLASPILATGQAGGSPQQVVQNILTKFHAGENVSNPSSMFDAGLNASGSSGGGMDQLLNVLIQGFNSIADAAAGR